MSNVYPANFTSQLGSISKPLNMTFEIDGISTVYSMAPVYKRISYGDTGITYGGGAYYGGLALVNDQKNYISDKSTMTISQKLEPEQGRASQSLMSLVLIDKNGEISNLVSPGGTVLPEILGVKATVRVGFQNTSFPDDYYVAFRSIITNIQVQSGSVTFTLGDVNQKRRQALFQVEKSILTNPVGISDTTITVNDASAFYQPILGPNGSYDSTVLYYVKIDDEIIQYSSITGNVINVSARGARGTTAADHTTAPSGSGSTGNDVVQSVQIQDHPMTLALKFMLSGWGGPYLTNIATVAVGSNLNLATPSVTNAIVLTKNAAIDYGLTIGDYVTVSGSTLGNNQTVTILSFEDSLGKFGNVIRTSAPFTLEESTALVCAFRSKYDTLPDGMGLQISPQDVDVAQHENLRDNYMVDSKYTMQLYIDAQQVGKDYIETELYYPIGCYSLTRFGQMSVNQTKPPIASVNLQFLNLSNVIDVPSITNARGLNNRKFFNSIQFQYDLQDDGSSYLSVLRSIDTDSINLIGITSLLPINSAGLKSSLGAAALVSKVSLNFLDRYKNAASEIAMKVNFAVGSKIEAGDVVAVQDQGYLKITDFNTGLRNLGTQLFEVTDRTFNVRTGEVTIKLVSGVFGNASDRYGTISPASVVSASASSTSTSIRVDSSYAPAAADETQKWLNYTGLPLQVRTVDWGVTGQATILSTDNSSLPYTINLSTALPFTPTAGMIVEIPPYPSATATYINSTYKAIYTSLDPTVNVTGGASASFTVSSSYIGRFFAGSVLYLRDSTFTNISNNLSVTSIDTGTNTVYLNGALGFTPTGGNYYAELIGFPDFGSGYRIY